MYARPSPGEALQLDAAGAELVGALLAALRALQMHAGANPAVSGALERLTVLLQGLCRARGRCEVALRGDDVYLEGHRVRVGPDERPRHEALVRYLKAAGVVRLEARGWPTRDDVRRALGAILQPAGAARRAEGLGSVAVERGGGAAPAAPAASLLDQRQYVLRVYVEALLFLQDVTQALQHGGAPPVRRAYRLVQDLVDVARVDVTPLLTVACVRDRRDVFFHHSVNVCLLTVALGHHLGMPRQALAELGVAGLLHDLGKLAVPARLLGKAEDLTAEERVLLDRIPLETVRVLARLGSLCLRYPEQLVLAHEHARMRSLREHVRQYGRHGLSCRTQVLAIANLYDALTTGRAHRDAYLPEHAMRVVRSLAGERFEPGLVDAFVQLMGAYPPGTLARLDDGSLAVVVQPPAGDDVQRPLVRRVARAQAEGSEGGYVDLAAPGEARHIVGVAHPVEQRVNVLRYLLG